VLDGHPLLLGDGDLLVFGTQRHSVPKMPQVTDGRISIAVFWYPENKGHIQNAGGQENSTYSNNEHEMIIDLEEELLRSALQASLVEY